MGMAKQMVFWLNFQHSISNESIPPMGTITFVQNHYWRFMGYKNIYSMRDKQLRMIVSKTKEFHPFNLTPSVLKKVYVIWKIFNVNCFP